VLLQHIDDLILAEPYFAHSSVSSRRILALSEGVSGAGSASTRITEAVGRIHGLPLEREAFSPLVAITVLCSHPFGLALRRLSRWP
jgi:hypothetical protein